MHLDELLDSQVALPSIPRIVAMVLTELNREDPSLLSITLLINSDIGLATRLLGLANSAQFNFSHQIGSVTDALAVLGLYQVRSLTVAAAMAGAFKSVPGLKLLDFWRYSLNVAKLSRTLARSARSNPGTAFTAGLVHAAGELVMHLGMPDQMRWLNERVEPLNPKRAKAEQHLLGYCYAQVGAGFAKSWEFPNEIVDAVEHQCAPFEQDRCEPLAAVLYLASWRARAQEEGLSEVQIANTFPYDVAATLEIDIDEVFQREPMNWTTSQESVDLFTG
jgi:HD-like signal output (HDOD) protein